MAFYNPQRVSFNPSASVIKSAGAVGDFLYQKSQNDFNSMLKKQENQRLMQQYGLDQKKFQHTAGMDSLKLMQQDIENQKQQELLKGKAFAFSKAQPEMYNSLKQQYGNDELGLLNAISGASSYSPPSSATHKGVFRQDPQGNLNYIQDNGSVTNLGFQVKQDDPKVTNTLTEYQAYADSLKRAGKQVPSFAEFYDKKQNAKQFGVGLRDYDESTSRLNQFAQANGITMDDLQNGDLSKLSSSQKSQLGHTVGAIEQVQRDRMPDWAKKEAVKLSQVVYSAGEISKLISTKDSGLLDNAFNQVNNFLGLGDDTELIRKSMLQSSYALYRNYMLKILSGTAVSASEGSRFTQGFGDLWHSDKVVASKAYQNMASLKARLQTLKDSYNPIVFNYRYGSLLRNVDTAIGNMQQIITGKRTTVQNRSQVIEELHNRGATPQQIDAYLRKKGL